MIKHLFITSLCFLALFFSCKKETPTIVFSNVEISTPTNKMVEINIPKALDNFSASETINTALLNQVKKLLDSENQDKKKTKTIEESIDVFNANFNAFVNDFPDATQPWDAQIDGEVLFQSPEIIGISLTSYFNTGGAHGMLYISFLNFDAKTGKQIDQNQLFSDINGFKAIAKTYFNKAVKDKDTLFDPDSFTLPQSIGYTNDGLVLLYNPYEIAPYSTGIIEFTIPFKAISDFLVFKDVH